MHLINDGVVVNGYDVSIQFLGSRSVRSYLCKMDDGSFYTCKNMAISKCMSISINTLDATGSKVAHSMHCSA